MTISQSIDVTRGNDNVFADLGFSEDEAMSLKVRADLMLHLRSFIREKGWTQQQAATFFQETQPRIGPKSRSTGSIELASLRSQ